MAHDNIYAKSIIKKKIEIQTKPRVHNDLSFPHKTSIHPPRCIILFLLYACYVKA